MRDIRTPSRIAAGFVAALAFLLGFALTPASVRVAEAQDVGRIQAVLTQDFGAPLNQVGKPTDSYVWAYTGATNSWSAKSSASVLGTLTAHGVLVGEGASPIAAVAPVASGSVLASAGVSSDPAMLTVGLLLDELGATPGSILYRGTTTTGYVALPPGSNTQVLTLTGGVPVWAAGASASSLSATLGVGASTGNHNITFTAGDSIQTSATSVLSVEGVPVAAFGSAANAILVVSDTTAGTGQGNGGGVCLTIHNASFSYVGGGPQVTLKCWKETGTGSDAATFAVATTNSSGTDDSLKFAVDSAGLVRSIISGAYGWTSSATDATPGTALDTALSRDSTSGAGFVDVGNGSVNNDSGTLQAAAITRRSAATGTALTITGGAATAGVGGLLTTAGGAGVGTDQNAGGFTASTGASSGAGTGSLLFQVPIVAASGTSPNSVFTVLTINGTGFQYSGRQNATTVGSVSLTASMGGSVSGAGGNAGLTGGAAGTAGGATGFAFLTGGANGVASGSTAGGAVLCTGGACSGTTTTGAGGAFTAAGGAGGTTSGTGGAASVTGGAGTGSTSGVGGLASLVGGAGSTGSNNNNAGGATIDTGASSGSGTGAVLVNVPVVAASGAGANSTATVLTINGAGCVYAGRQNATTVGAVSFTASQGGSTSGAGGGASLIAGAAGTAGGATGTVTITGGANAIASGSTAGGQVNVTAGACSGTTSTGAGGALVCAGGAGGTTSGAGGAASLTAGAGTGSTSGAGGLATLAGGAGSTGSNNNAAGGVTITTGLPSGTGTADIAMQSGYTLASGSTVQTTYDRLRITSKTTTCSNTTNTSTFVVDLNLATSNSGGGCTIFYTFEVADASNHASAVCGSFIVAASNSNGTVTAAVDTLGTSNLVTSDTSTFTTLTMAVPAPTISTTHVQVNVKPTWAAGTVTSAKFTYTVISNGRVTVTPQ